ncbi:hypothetical protein [Streptomyces sp. NPDC001809]
MKAERAGRETERILREHEEARGEIHGHVDHIRASLAALTGRAAAPSRDPSSDPGPSAEQR